MVKLENNYSAPFSLIYLSYLSSVTFEIVKIYHHKYLLTIAPGQSYPKKASQLTPFKLNEVLNLFLSSVL